MTDDEKFFAWLDGELSADEAIEMERRIADDPRLQELAEQHRAIHAQLRRAFDPIAESPVPERLLSSIRQPGAEMIDLAAAKQAREARYSWKPMTQWAAMAATLAVGIVVGTMVPQRSAAPVEVHGGRMYAASALGRALDTELASAPSGVDVRIGVTFRDQTGAICRSFTGEQASGLACRSADRWQVRGLFAAPEGQSSDYRMAAGMSPALAALIDAANAGEPFDAATEKAARDRGWK